MSEQDLLIPKTRKCHQTYYGCINETSIRFDPSNLPFPINDVSTQKSNQNYLNQIRQQSGTMGGPAMVTFKVSRSRRCPIFRTKSEPDLGALVDEDVEALRASLVRRYGKNERYVLKGLPKFSRKQWLVLFSIALVDFTSFCAMSILAPFFPAEAAEKGVSTSVSGFVFSVYALVVFLASPLMGMIVAKVGPKFLLIVGILLGGVCNLLFGFLNRVSPATMFITYCFIVRTFEALGAAAFATSSYTFVAKLFPDNLGGVLGILETFVGLGLAVGPAIGGLLYDYGGYTLPFVVLGSVMLLTIPINLLLLPSTDVAEEHTSSNGSVIQLLKIPPIFIICLVVIIASNTWGFLDPTLSIHLSEFDFSAKQLGLFFLINSFVYAASSPFWGYVADKMTRTWILMFAGLLLNTIGLLLLGPAPFLQIPNLIWVNVLSLVILGVSIAMTLISTFEAILDLALDVGYNDDMSTYGLIAGVWSSVYSLGEVIGPSLGGFLLEKFDFPVASTFMAALSFLLAIFVVVYFCNIASPYESQIVQVPGEVDKKEGPSDVDSGISENIIAITSRSTSSLSLESSTPNEETPVLRSFEEKHNSAETLSQKSFEKSEGRRHSLEDLFPFANFPDILKTISITGEGAVEI